MRSVECGIVMLRSDRECDRSSQCQPLNAAFRIPHSALVVDSRRAYPRPARRVNSWHRMLLLPAPSPLLPLQLSAPRSLLPPYVALPKRRELNHSSLKRRRTDLGRCDGDHHEVVADLLQTATIRYATTGRPEARLLRGAALRACHGCDVRSGHATRKSADGLELMPV